MTRDKRSNVAYGTAERVIVFLEYLGLDSRVHILKVCRICFWSVAIIFCFVDEFEL